MSYIHWRRSALNSAGALQGGGGEFRGFALKTYSKHTKYAQNFGAGRKSTGARAPVAPASSAPLQILLHFFVRKYTLFSKQFLHKLFFVVDVVSSYTIFTLTFFFAKMFGLRLSTVS